MCAIEHVFVHPTIVAAERAVRVKSVRDVMKYGIRNLNTYLSSK